MKYENEMKTNKLEKRQGKLFYLSDTSSASVRKKYELFHCLINSVWPFGFIFHNNTSFNSAGRKYKLLINQPE